MGHRLRRPLPRRARAMDPPRPVVGAVGRGVHRRGGRAAAAAAPRPARDERARQLRPPTVAPRRHLRPGIRRSGRDRPPRRGPPARRRHPGRARRPGRPRAGEGRTTRRPNAPGPAADAIQSGGNQTISEGSAAQGMVERESAEPRPPSGSGGVGPEARGARGALCCAGPGPEGTGPGAAEAGSSGVRRVAPAMIQTTEWRKQIPLMRVALYVGSFLVFLAGIQLFVLTTRTDHYFAWTIANPFTAAFLGAFYWTAIGRAPE